MRYDRIADVPLAQVQVTARRASGSAALDIATRLVIVAMASAVLFLAVRIVGQF